MSLTFGILAFPGVQQLDLAGPFEVFASVPGARVHVIWKRLEPIVSATGLVLTPTVTFGDCPPLDVLCVPGGGGVNALMEDEETLAFLRKAASAARFVTAVCTGTLVLGAAGLITGRRATTHWYAHDFLPAFGAIPEKARVVEDGNLITAGGVTSGIDFGLAVVAALVGQVEAEAVQLGLEYAPEPPFDAGTPETAGPAVLEAVRARLGATRSAREEIVARMAGRLEAAAGS